MELIPVFANAAAEQAQWITIVAYSGAIIGIICFLIAFYYGFKQKDRTTLGKEVGIFLIASVIGFILSFCATAAQPRVNSAITPDSTATPAASVPSMLNSEVNGVYDVHLIEIQDVGKVRLLGIAPPDKSKQEVYDRALKETVKLCFEKKVSIKIDEAASLDEQGNILGYLWLPDETMLNQRLIALGYATVLEDMPEFEYRNEFLNAQKKAVKQKAGLWAPVTPQTTLTPAACTSSVVYITGKGKKHHTSKCRYLKRSFVPISKSEAEAKGYTPCTECGAK